MAEQKPLVPYEIPVKDEVGTVVGWVLDYGLDVRQDLAVVMSVDGRLCTVTIPVRGLT